MEALARQTLAAVQALQATVQALQATVQALQAPDTAQRLEAVEERLRGLNLAGTAPTSASARGSVNPRGG
jgi:prefoldin subunit 5